MEVKTRERRGSRESECFPAIGVDRVTETIIGAAIEVHRNPGPGLLESAYEECLCYELGRRGIGFHRQVSLPVSYKGIRLDCGYKMDLLAEDSVVAELKTVDRLLPLHSAQLLTYLKLSGKQVGSLINFNEPVLKRGLKRRFAEPRGNPGTSVASAREAGEEGETARSPETLQARRLGVSAVKSNPTPVKSKATAVK